MDERGDWAGRSLSHPDRLPDVQAAGQWVADITEFRRIAVRRYREATGGNPTSGWGAAGEA